MPARTPQPKKQQWTRLPPHVLAKLKTMADAERRAVSPMIAVLVEEALAARASRAVKATRELLPVEGVMG